MWPVIGTGIAAGASALGQWLANKSNLKIAREQMAFQERMSSTSYQRAVKDMRLAGINPMLAYMQGGASSPGGASATMGDVLGPAVNTAMSAVRLRQEIRNMKADINLKDKTGSKLDADNALATATASEVRARSQVYKYGPFGPNGISYAALAEKQRFMNLQLEGALLKAGIPAAQIQGSKPAAISRLLFGGAGVVPGVVGSVVGATGVKRLGNLVKPKGRR